MFLYQICIGTLITLCLTLVIQNPWFGVLVVSIGLGKYIIDNERMAARIRYSDENAIELHKEILGLRSIIRSQLCCHMDKHPNTPSTTSQKFGNNCPKSSYF